MNGRAILPFALACAAWSCAGTPVSAPPASAKSRAPYEAPPAARHALGVNIDARAARDLLTFLSRPEFQPADAKALEELPAIRLALKDSGRTPEVFERDLAAAFAEETRSAVFEFHTIRTGRARWEQLLAAISSRESSLSRMAADRAAALLPADRPIAARLQVFLSFGLAGLADHLVVSMPDGGEAMIVDLARALGETEAESVDSQLERVARLIAGEAFRQGWRTYRSESPNWTSRDPGLGVLETLFKIVAEQGPIALFHVDENFFPLSVWLKEPMKRTIPDFNRTAENLVESEKDLEKRMTLASEITRPDFAQRVAGPAGAFLCDGIIQNSGLDAFRAALAGGPRAFFVAYDEAQQKSRDLIPLSPVIRERLKAPKSGAPAQ
ncbi:MAG TPA: hypothetical protein VLE54_04500 [Thermoanaerobaculia bacterium]|nr:hypothetical protein [Thermoanaerobaculia bacterium]